MQQFGIDPKEFDSRSVVAQVDFIEESRTTPAYLKIYTYHKHPLQRIFRYGRSFYESRNLLFFRSLGIPAAKVIAWGKCRNIIGRITEEFIITEAVEGAIPLDQYVRKERPGALEAARVAKRLAQWLRLLHANDFFHKDLHWRNILIRKTNQGIALCLIDCPRGGFHRFNPIRRHWRIKDCASLDKSACVLFPNIARAVFLRHYLGASRDSETFKQWSRRIPQYRKLRFDQRKGRRKIAPLDRSNTLPD